jgi:hypothetical protein
MRLSTSGYSAEHGVAIRVLAPAAIPAKKRRRLTSVYKVCSGHRDKHADDA